MTRTRRLPPRVSAWEHVPQRFGIACLLSPFQSATSPLKARDICHAQVLVAMFLFYIVLFARFYLLSPLGTGNYTHKGIVAHIKQELFVHISVLLHSTHLLAAVEPANQSSPAPLLLSRRCDLCRRSSGSLRGQREAR